MDSQINNSLFEVSHPQITKKMNVKTILLSVLSIVVGVVFFVLYSSTEDSTSSGATFAMVLGVLSILSGCFLFFMKGKQNVYNPSGSVVKKKSYFFNKEQSNGFSRILSEGNFPQTEHIIFLQNGNMRIDTIVSNDNKFAAVQLFEYIPHSYRPVSQIYYFSDNKAASFSDYLKYCRNNNMLKI